MPREKSPTRRDGRKARATQDRRQAIRRRLQFTQFVDPEKRAALIAEAAYFRAEKRGFAPGTRAARTGSRPESEVDAPAAAGAESRPAGLASRP